MFNMHLKTFLEIQIHETCASSVWKYDESTIVYFQMDKALLCINVFKKISYHNHNILKFSYKSMLKILKIN
jgi:hypothetical protein